MAAGWPALGLDAVHARLTGPGSEFEMAPLSIGERRVRVYRNAPPTLRAVFEASRAFDERRCIVFEDESLTYREHRRAVTAIANAFSARYGVGKGDRVAIAMRNWPEWSMLFWATVGIGAVAVPLNAWGTRFELEAAIRDCAPRLLAVDAERFETLGRPTAGRLGVEDVLLVRGAGTATGIESLVDDSDARDDDTLPAVDLSPEDPATILYTSGTSGRAKGAIASHRNIMSNVLSRRFGAARAALRRGDPAPPAVSGDPGARMLCPVPLFHVTGCHTYLVPTFASGNTIVLMHRWSPERALELIERERISVMGGVPTMAVQLLDALSTSGRDASSLRSLNFGGSPSGKSLVSRIRTELPGVHTGNGYGMTETCSLITQNTAEDHALRPDSVGLPVPVCDVHVFDDDGVEVPRGEVGEIRVRGANVVAGYWQRPEADAETFVDGWLRTGDVGWVDDDGFVYLVDRLKDIVIRGGENVFCAEVEDALLGHPRVIESAVFGVPDPVLGERVAAAVEVSPGAPVDEDVLRRAVAERLAAFKVPEHVEIRFDPLPRNAAGKVLKSRLREDWLRR